MKFLSLFFFLFCSVSSATDLRIESISITKSDDPKEFLQFMGDYIVVAKIRNQTDQPILVRRHSVFNQIRHDKLVGKEVKTSYTTDFHKNNSTCCHPPKFDVIAPNQIYTLRYRDSSKNNGQQMLLTITGKEKTISLGHYVLRLTKETKVFQPR